MARGVICDACGASVSFNAANGRESELAEESAWITLRADNVREHHACTRECAKAIIDGDFGDKVQAAYESIVTVALAIQDESAGDDNDGG